MKIFKLADLHNDFVLAAQFVVNDCVDLLLADRDHGGRSESNPAALTIKPAVMEKMKSQVALGISSAGMRRGHSAFGNLQQGRDYDLNSSLEAIVKDCLHRCRGVKPVFLKATPD